MVSNRLTGNLGYKVLALILAVIVWLLVINVEDPVITREFTNITVSEINASVITDAGKSYSYVNEKNTVNVKVSGRTSLMNKVVRDDISAVVDLSKLSDTTGAVIVDVACEKYPSLSCTTEGSSGILRVEIEDLVEKSFNVQIISEGTIPEGRHIGSGQATPNLITVSGPESLVNKIASAVVKVAVNEQTTKDITTNCEVTLVDSSGKEVKTKQLTLSENEIKVSIPMLYTKTVPLKLLVIGNAPDGYYVESCEYEPKQITVAGTLEDLDLVSMVYMKDYEMPSMTEKIEASLVIADNLASSLPDGVVFVDSSATVAIAIDIKKDVSITTSEEESSEPE